MTKENDRIQQEIKDFMNRGQQRFPVVIVDTAVKAIDAVFPELMEDRILRITRMYLEGKKPAQIAEATGIHVKAVEAELARLDQARTLAYTVSPETALKVLDEHFDVMSVSEDMIVDSLKVMSDVQDEMRRDHNTKVSLEKIVKTAMENAQYGDEEAIKALPGLLKEYKMAGIKPKLLEAFWQGSDAIGKHQDRLAELLGLMRGKGDNQFNQIINNVTFNSSQLNNMADALLKSVGGIPMTSFENAPIDAEIVQENK